MCNKTDMCYMSHILRRLNAATQQVANLNKIRHYPKSDLTKFRCDAELMSEIRAHISFLEAPHYAHIMFAKSSQANRVKNEKHSFTSAGQPRWGPDER